MLKKVRQSFKDNDKVVFLAVQTVFEGHFTNTRDKLVSTQKQYKLPILMGHDAGTFSKRQPYPPTMIQYRTGGTPWVVIIDMDGTVVFNHFHIKPDDAVSLINNLLKKNS